MDTYFKIGDEVVALATVQTMSKGERYTVTNAEPTSIGIFGEFVMYTLQAVDGRLLSVTNGHLLLRKVEPAPKQIKRHAKKLQGKSRGHVVKLLDAACNRYSVVSGTSGTEYIVNVFSDNTAGCSCDWAAHHNEQGVSTCSHTIAVFNYIMQEQRATVSAWDAAEQAAKQHRQVINVGDGVLLTVRRKHYRQLEMQF